MAELKKALAIELPVKANSNGIITLMTNQKAQTSIKKIVSIGYNEGYIFITIETKNSIYKDIPMPVSIQNTFFNGQIIEPGATVMTCDGRCITVSSILEITENGIKILDNNNQSYTGSITPMVA